MCLLIVCNVQCAHVEGTTAVASVLILLPFLFTKREDFKTGNRSKTRENKHPPFPFISLLRRSIKRVRGMLKLVRLLGCSDSSAMSRVDGQ